eukprot:Gb_03301 [translate_table: standard]
MVTIDDGEQELPMKSTPKEDKDHSEDTKNSETLYSEVKKNEQTEGAHMGSPDADREGEGWETASEGEKEDEGPTISVPPEESYEDAMTEEEQKRRSLAQANDAKAEGNRLYAAEQYEEALAQYASALEVAPDDVIANDMRSMCYANRAICFSKLNKYEQTVKESTKALELNPTYIKALIRRAEAQERLEHFEEAITDMKKVLEVDASNEQARKTIIRLEPLAAEKREKLKEEMIGKLKDLGNSVLGRFGMSVDNFKAVKDPNTGSYSISFQR